MFNTSKEKIRARIEIVACKTSDKNSVQFFIVDSQSYWSPAVYFHTYTGQVEHRLLHPGEAVARDAQHLSSRRHLSRQQLHVPPVHAHAVAFHHRLDFTDDRGLGCFDA